MAKVAVYTLGCKVNQAESEELKLDLVDAGHLVIDDPAEADLCVVNTCTVTSESDRKCRKLIRWLERRGARSILAAGCYAQTNPHDLEALPGVTGVLGNDRKDLWKDEILALLPSGDGEERGADHIRARGFLKIQDGCERHCSYCIVPLARGRERSLPAVEVMEAARRWLNRGSRELVLCGVNLGRYGRDRGCDLNDLVGEICRIGEGFRVRLSSIELEDLDGGWLEAWRDLGRVCPHLHLPLQSGDWDILADMGRGYAPEDFTGSVREARSVWPEITLTTEVIVGYPNEGEMAFGRTVEALEKSRPTKIHVFRFSPRPGTRAWDKGGRPPPETVEKRAALLRSMAAKWREAYLEGCIGERREILLESVRVSGTERHATGTTEDYLKARLIDPPGGAEPGMLVSGVIYEVRGGIAVMR